MFAVPGARADLQNQKYTVAPALTAATLLLVFAYSSDHFRERGFHMSVPLVLSMVGYAVLLAVDVEKQKGIGYMAIFFCTIGVRAKLSALVYPCMLTVFFFFSRLTQ